MRWNGCLGRIKSVHFWNLRISLSATVPGADRRLTLATLFFLELGATIRVIVMGAGGDETIVGGLPYAGLPCEAGL